MDKILISMGDFLKNAGIVGLNYMLEQSEAAKDVDYGITDDGQYFWLDREFAQNADWTDIYFKGFISYFKPFTTYTKIVENIDNCVNKLEKGEWENKKDDKELLKYINDKMLSNSYKAGFENIKTKIENADVYERLNKNKLNEKLGTDELLNRLKDLKAFVTQPLCEETFAMKSIIYTFINRFWNDKCFLLRTNAKRDMKEVFEQDFSRTLKEYWANPCGKSKDLCVECGEPMDPKEKVSIAFMVDVADDLSRKRSAFWNCKVDAYICPACAFLYASSPLGFTLYSNKFIFLNRNSSIYDLLASNRKYSGEGDRLEDEKYFTWIARMMNDVLIKEENRLDNLQVILRSTDTNSHYEFSIIQNEILKILSDRNIKKHLDYLAKSPSIKIKNDFLNVHEEAVMNILRYRNQYGLLKRLLRESLVNESNFILFCAYQVYMIQIRSEIIKKVGITDEKGKWMIMGRMDMRNAGYELRKEILKMKGAANDNDECMRGTVYQLLNALSARNNDKFMDMVIRLYNSCKLLIPDGFVDMLGKNEKSQEKFMEYGYAFVLGLKGSHPDEKKGDK